MNLRKSIYRKNINEVIDTSLLSSYIYILSETKNYIAKVKKDDVDKYNITVIWVNIEYSNIITIQMKTNTISHYINDNIFTVCNNKKLIKLYNSIVKE